MSREVLPPSSLFTGDMQEDETEVPVVEVLNCQELIVITQEAKGT